MEKITVIFRKWSNGDIIALFPYEIENGGHIMSYEHIGQHGAANYDHVISKTKPATQEEYQPLLNELMKIYNDGDVPEWEFVVRKKRNRKLFIKAFGER